MKIIKKVGMLIMAVGTMITMSACTKMNKDTAEEVCRALEEKYGQAFTAVKIGDRLNTEHAKLYVHPDEQEELLFTAKLDRTTRMVSDDYIVTKVCFKVKEAIEKAFEEENITSVSRCMIVNSEEKVFEKKDWEPASFMEKHEYDHYTMYLVLDEKNASSDSILHVLKKVSADLQVKMVVTVCLFGTEAYEACKDEMMQYPEMSLTMIESHNPGSTFDVVIDKGIPSITENELAQKIER